MDLELKAELQATQTAAGAPGVAAIALSQQQVLAQAAVGVKRLGNQDPLSLADKFHIGSNAKAMTATMIAALVQEGLVGWESRPAALMPELDGEMHPALAGVTLEQILRHRAGLPPFTELEHFETAPPLSGSPQAQRRAFTRWLLAQKPLRPPGQAFAYSNAGYGVATALVEAATGASWEQLMVERLFKRLGLDAGFGWPGHDGSDQPWGHMAEAGEPLAPVDPVQSDYQLPPAIAPAGDVHLPLSDYGKFLQLHLAALHGHNGYLPAATLRHLHQEVDGVGLGWGVQRFLEQKVSAHAGGAGTFIVVGFVHHEKDLAAAVAANAGTEQAEQAVVAQLKAMLARYG